MSTTQKSYIDPQIQKLRLTCDENCDVSKMNGLLKKWFDKIFSKPRSVLKERSITPETYKSNKELNELFCLDGPLSTRESLARLFDFFKLHGITKESVDPTTDIAFINFDVLSADEINDVMKYIEVIPTISLRGVLMNACQLAMKKIYLNCSSFFNTTPSLMNFACGKPTPQKKKREIIIECLKLHGVTFVTSPANPDLRFEFGSLFDLEAFLDDVVQRLGVEFIEAIPESKMEAAREYVTGGGAASNKIFLNIKQFFQIRSRFMVKVFNTKLFLELVGLQTESITEEMIKKFQNLLKRFSFRILKTGLSIPIENFQFHIDHFCLQVMNILNISTEGIRVEPAINSGIELMDRLDKVIVCSSSTTGKPCRCGSKCNFLHQTNPFAQFGLITWSNGYTFTVCHACPEYKGSNVPQWGTPVQSCTRENCPHGHFDVSVKNHIYKQQQQKKKYAPLSKAVKAMSLGGGGAAACVRHSPVQATIFLADDLCVSGVEPCCSEVFSILHCSDKNPQYQASCVVVAQCQHFTSFSCEVFQALSNKRASESDQSPPEKKSRMDSSKRDFELDAIQKFIDEQAKNGKF